MVLGNESSGKSSLIDRLAMMPLLPRGEGTCTRIAINLRMRHSDVPKVPLLRVLDVQSGEVLRQVPLAVVGGEVDVREQMNAIILEEHPQLDSVRSALAPCAMCDPDQPSPSSPPVCHTCFRPTVPPAPLRCARPR